MGFGYMIAREVLITSPARKAAEQRRQARAAEREAEKRTRARVRQSPALDAVERAYKAHLDAAQHVRQVHLTEIARLEVQLTKIRAEQAKMLAQKIAECDADEAGK